MIVAFFGAWLAAVALAWALARQHPEHRPIALFLSTCLAAEVLRGLLAGPVASGALGAWVGSVLVDGLALVSPAALVVTALAVFAGKRSWVPLAGWAGALALIVLIRPRTVGPWGESIFFTLAQVLAATGSAALAAVWFRGAWIARRAPTSAHFTLMAIVVTEVVSLLGAWRLGPRESWDISQILYLTMFAMVCLIQGRFLCSPLRSMPRPS